MNTDQNITREQLSRQFESACAVAAQLYADGCDTAAADALVDSLLEQLERMEA